MIKTSQEKAKELVDKYLPEVKSADKYDFNLESINISIAKRCATDLADEMIDRCNHLQRYSKAYFGEMSTDHWQEVKQEIEKLKLTTNYA